jgi:LmbE family N-acetylglucosaminyl deacetylase
MVIRVKPNLIDAPGTPEAAWRAWRGLKLLPTADTKGWASVVVVAAHPDDEVLGAGGTISELAARNARLRLVAVTDGEASHHDGLAAGRRATLARRRAAERSAALAALGAQRAEVIRLELPDSGLAAYEQELAAQLQELVSGFDICLAPWHKDAHSDHEVAGRAARQASRRTLFYPVWMWHWAQPGDIRVPWHSGVRVPLPRSTVARKRRAISRFASQLQDRSPQTGPVLPADIVAHFIRDYEVFFQVSQS